MTALLLALLLQTVTPNAEALFEQGNAFYAQGDAAAAIATYEAVETEGVTSAALHRNLAQAHRDLGHLAAARYHAEQALRLAPSDAATAALRADLLRALNVTGSASTPPLVALARSVTFGLPPRAVLTLGVGLYLVAMLGLGWRVLRHGWPTAVRRATWAVLPLAALLLGAGFVLDADARVPAAIALQASVVPAPTPGQPPEGAPLAEGGRYRVVAREGPWIALRLPDGSTGWVPTPSVGLVW